MIGVLVQPHERPFVAEFFELFKTPWEHARSGKTYDVLLATGDCPENIHAALLIICSSRAVAGDAGTVRSHSPLPQACIVSQGETFPVYGGALTFETAHRSVAVTAGGRACAGFQFRAGETAVIRLGYGLFSEVETLLSRGQPARHAHFPALDQHVSVLRRFMIEAGLVVVEIPPVPAGRPYFACLTHDIDFLSLRQHLFDRTMFGFLARATLGSVRNAARGRFGFRRVLDNWLAAIRLPFVHLGWASDFWLPFAGYFAADGRPATFFLIPFKKCDGQAPAGRSSRRRATRCDIGDMAEWTPALRRQRCEIGVHGLDAWCDAGAGGRELRRVCEKAGSASAGVRMHWLYFSPDSPRLLDQAGFDYDATCGYNEAVGFRAGTAQVFRPPGAQHLLELPFQIQDTALFYPDRMDLSEAGAWEHCLGLVESVRNHGGVLTLSWHDRSLVPERQWKEFYLALLRKLEADSPWFGTAGEIVGWFRARRQVAFARVEQAGNSCTVSVDHAPSDLRPGLALRFSWQAASRETCRIEVPLQSRNVVTLDSSLSCHSRLATPVVRPCADGGIVVEEGIS